MTTDPNCPRCHGTGIDPEYSKPGDTDMWGTTVGPPYFEPCAACCDRPPVDLTDVPIEDIEIKPVYRTLEEAREAVMDWLLRGVDALDSKDAVADLDAYVKAVQRADAAKIRAYEAPNFHDLAGVRQELADLIDPDKEPS